MPIIRNADVDKLNGLAPRACELCHASDNVRRCAACQAVYYCGRRCQLADFDEHKIPCRVVKKARLHYEGEYVKLRDMPGPDRIFETCRGRFWDIIETRPYMQARYAFVDALLLSYGTAGGPAELVQTALDHLLDMLRLNRRDNLGLRYVIPAQYIRLGRDQDAYDFVEWWVEYFQYIDHDIGDMDLPFLNIKGADMLEAPPKIWLDAHSHMSDISHLAAQLLIKVRVLLDLWTIQNADLALRGAKPQEIIDLIRGHLVGPAVRARPELLLARPDETARSTGAIKAQIQQLYRAVESRNPHFWKLLIEDPDASVLWRPNGYNLSSRDNALVMVGYCYAAWYETPGAMDVLKRLRDANKPE
ncbi:hypothetical protein G6O67_001094 [Ophiocordyceps sinensis]|uniref:MYND-type domain-containing protein n=2 Tax=Ophiocordyceps sinensis TaxID=72228 RepID=A0A8H4V8I3_9HYPO|nr:MYND finger [Ophiocordyceps sinensis CO18]KAF4511893.1 hypothetical protein G6O67_001094 [Ophiocordyceps sinensis]